MINMPRRAREQSPTQYYHVMMRGINKGIEKFHFEEESILFLDTDEEVEKIKHEIVNNIIKEYCSNNGIIEVSQIKNNPENLSNIIKILLKQGQFTHREIAETLVVNRNLVHLANKDKK